MAAARGQVFETPILDQYIPPSSAGGGTAFQPGVTVATRSRPQYESPGVQFSDVVVRPELDESVGYDSNPAGTAVPKGSARIETQAQVAAALDEPISSFRLSGYADDVRYPGLSIQSYTDWGVTAGAEHQFGLDDLTLNYSHQRLNVLPSGLNVANTQQPVPFSLDDGVVAYRIALGPAFVTPSADVTVFNFASIPVPGTAFTQTFNNRIVVTPTVTAGYEIATRRTVVVVLRDSDASYTQSTPTLPTRDYNDFAMLGGLDYDTDVVIRFRALIGYERRTFRTNQVGTIQAPIFEATAIWTPAGTVTVTGTVSRRIEAATDNTTTGFTETYAQLRVDDEFLPNVLLYARGGFYFDRYQEIGNQSLGAAGVGGNWLLNRNMQLGVSYDVFARASGSSAVTAVVGPSYIDNRFLVSFKFKL